ncbi:flagellar type III secretion system pore protein FliP [Dissulfurimicrobium hydrothermale]|uniref:flagellar type III secretion system pore protein FliP n=1 Tax=Dissulfurimicrobium hydrothermale TaxID=1750598 RepID=UPI001EDC1396|nr:flagellar type III secretion system pore protein FliP [Dissulfurimicrobium hydrothermale]UKL13475.1 flagellar type III secretion system pore protein FliP [Dissulfurimicrobium hydrothermale]
MSYTRPFLIPVATASFLLTLTCTSWAITIPTLKIGLEGGDSPAKVATALEIIALLTVLSIAPSILLMTTSFTRLIIVFGFLRQALGTQQMPPNQVLAGLALFLTFFIMQPVWSQANSTAVRPYLNEEISFDEAVKRIQVPFRDFMFKQTRESDLALFVKLAKIKDPKDRDAIPTLTLIPAFMISELKTAFEIGFILFLPFLIIDMMVSSVLLSLGMMMLPPILISLPFKLLLFVLVDGWNLLVGSLVKSFF